MSYAEKCVNIEKDLLEKVLEANPAELSNRETEMIVYFAYGMVLKRAEIDKKDNREVQGYFPCGWQGRFPEGKLFVC